MAARHFHRGRRRLRIDAATVRHADHEIEISHRLAEETRGDLVEAELLPLAPSG